MFDIPPIGLISHIDVSRVICCPQKVCVCSFTESMWVDIRLTKSPAFVHSRYVL